MNIRKLLLTGLALSSAFAAHAQFAPIEVTPESFTYDVVVERTATPPLTPVTTASMDGGTNNNNFSFYEIGYNRDSPDTGLPLAGSTFTHQNLATHSYTMAASYTTSNVVLIDTAVTNGTINLTTPAAYSSLSFLNSSGNGTVTINYTVHHADGTSEQGTFVSSDWFGGASQAYTANGRVDVGNRTFANLFSDNPRLYGADVALTNSSSPVTRIELKRVSGGGHAAIFAVSGSTGANFTPIAITGFNHDIMVEAGAAPAITALGATTASMDAGLNNTGASWYEVGYNPQAPATGLPASGTIFTNASSPNYLFRAPNYTNNNAILIDSLNFGNTFTLVTPRSYSALSLLTSAGGGAVTINYTVNYQDGSTQNGSVISPDWFNNNPVALVSSGRVDVVNAGLSAVNTMNPRLYAVEFVLEKTSTPVTSVALSYASGAGHAAIMALSGTAGAVRPIIDQQPVSTAAFLGSTAQFVANVSGTAPLSFQWQRETNGTFGNIGNDGRITGATSTNLMLSNLMRSDAGSYQLVINNSAGSVTSAVVRLTVLSTTPDITAPGDVITGFGGNSPGGEPVENSIDNTTSKYLNFGGNGGSPFLGPVGLTVTPAAGSTVISGARFYTANDAPERDPANYVIEGSTDGTNFTQITSGTLALPDNRNDGGLTVDPLLRFNQEVAFANSSAYTTYRISFTSVKDAGANAMQIGEIELLGVPGVSGPRLTISKASPGFVTITSSAPGRLQSTDALRSPASLIVWREEGPINGSVTVPSTGTARFYRVINP